jgi:hypothetical protein
MIEINCSKLYKIPITISLLNEFYEIGEAFGRRNATVHQIYNIKDISDKLKTSWLMQYNREWHENLSSTLDRLREKANLKNEKYVITYDLDSREIVVIDILRKDYKLLCKEHSYLVKLNINNKPC